MKKGFTLIELMVTIAVIGVLAAIAIPRFSNITKDAEIAQIQANRRNIETALHMYLVKEDKKVEDLFPYGTASNGETVVMKAGDLEKFIKDYLGGKVPFIPVIKVNGIGTIKDKDKIEEIIEKANLRGFGWIFMRSGEVYPLVKEEKYGIRFDEF
ncbi:hypothetical protein PM10SUCC1_23580 [Propionigenium maris DSM 9537]|uniref:Prepilin-type N-terminal cleavage/methylation domain-containing protein n=1 Tax=Propionigenium maris DSM 9537 TaxID=1123000 RepID=A0A9W6GKK4_9FUSO|nr:type II secretion system protein [Propionigenium maris]GLI56844.1 hypothetical protein PM10SUCC1_23580 [Propionigenium maris DSM 9537]